MGSIKKASEVYNTYISPILFQKLKNGNKACQANGTEEKAGRGIPACK